MKILLTLIATIQVTFAQTKIAVMESAFGLRCSIDSIKLAKESGYSGIQIDAGKIEKNSRMTISDTSLQYDLKRASREHGVEIISLYVGAMNEIDITKPGESRKKGSTVMIRSMNACQKLGCKVIVLPLFGPSNFQDSDAKMTGVAEFLREIRPAAEHHGVIIGIEAPVSHERFEKLRKSIWNPVCVQSYYNTGNMARQGEDIHKALRTLGKNKVCEIHLKPAKGNFFGKDDSTKLEKLANTLDEIGYDGWLVFEPEAGVKEGKTQLAKENLESIQKLVSLRKKAAQPADNTK